LRRVLYVTGSRADYGPVRRVLKAIDSDPELELGVLVTGMHLDPVHGETWREIEADGFRISERVYGRITGDSTETMAASVGLYLSGMSHAIARIRPQIVLLLGDRGEQLAGAMAAAFQNVAVVHLCGGSLSGSIDDSVRHAISKFAHYHLPACEEHASRIVQMGEAPDTVNVVGLPGGDIRPDVTFSRVDVSGELGLEDGPYLLVIQHPVTQSEHETSKEITETLEAVAMLGHVTLLANPNDDARGRTVHSMMQEYADRHAHIHVLPPPASRERFASTMAHAAVLIGNSSSAVAEAMSVGVPVVNIGERQRGREHLGCWINVGHDRNEILRGIDTALNDTKFRSQLSEFESPLIQPDTEARVVDYLRNLDLGTATRPKVFYTPADAAAVV
jgi:GDP/UDP-N,N'-diacetylbacillosamine 2-epimerase (hydrolysing)